MKKSRYKTYYEEWYSKHKSHPTTWYKRLTDPFYISRREAVFRLLDTGGTYLDIGCGDGSLIERAVEIYDKCYGVDISQEAVNRAKDRLKDYTKVQLIQCDIDEGYLNFSDGTFDCVTCVAVL